MCVDWGGAMRRNSAQRDRYRAALAKAGAQCHICGQPIDYSLPYRIPTRGPRGDMSTCEQLLAELQAAVQRIKDLHHPITLDYDPWEECEHCGEEWPCSTDRALRGPTT